METSQPSTRNTLNLRTELPTSPNCCEAPAMKVQLILLRGYPESPSVAPIPGSVVSISRFVLFVVKFKLRHSILVLLGEYSDSDLVLQSHVSEWPISLMA